MKASISRMVHYVSYGTPGGEFLPACRAAVVTEVHDATLGVVTLCVLNPSGIFFNDCVQDELPPADKILPGERTTHLGGTWHWPERVNED